MKKNLLHIDEIRFLIIHVILINHWQLNLFIANKPTDRSLVDFWFDLTSPSLALISGYLFFFRTKEKFDFPRKLKSRVASLIIPYLFWTISFFVIYYIMKESFEILFHKTEWYRPVMDLNFKNLLSVFLNPPLLNFWYLQNLILIIPFNFLFYYLLRTRYLFILFFLIIIAIYSFQWVGLYFQPRFLPYYLMGCFLGYHEKMIPKFYLNKWLSLLMVLVLFVLGTRTSNLEYSNAFNLIIKMVIVLFFVFGIFNLIDSNMDNVIVRYLKRNKTYSFFLFAINMFLFSLVERALLLAGFEGYLQNKYFTLLFVCVSYGIVLWLALTLARFLHTKTPRFYHFISGR